MGKHRETYEGYGITELRRHASELAIPGRSKMTGTELLAACHAGWSAERIASEDMVIAALAPKRDATGKVTDRFGVSYTLGASTFVRDMVVELIDGYTSWDAIPRIVAVRHGVDVADVKIMTVCRIAAKAPAPVTATEEATAPVTETAPATVTDPDMPMTRERAVAARVADGRVSSLRYRVDYTLKATGDTLHRVTLPCPGDGTGWADIHARVALRHAACLSHVVIVSCALIGTV